MKIIIRETNHHETLSISDPRTGIDYTSDFIGNAGALIDGQFEYDDDQGAYVCDQGTYDWWQKVLADNQALEDRIYELVHEHGSDAVYAVVNDAGSTDIEDHAANVNQALDEAFGDQ
jgi:hypothetical protein